MVVKLCLVLGPVIGLYACHWFADAQRVFDMLPISYEKGFDELVKTGDSPRRLMKLATEASMCPATNSD